MKNLIKYFTFLLLAVCMGSCQKDEMYTEFPAPVWQVDDAKYSVNMTAVVVLPNNLLPYFNENDQVAAFINDECRGVGILVDNAFFVTIKGTPEEISNVSFRYIVRKINICIRQIPFCLLSRMLYMVRSMLRKCYP